MSYGPANVNTVWQRWWLLSIILPERRLKWLPILLEFLERCPDLSNRLCNVSFGLRAEKSFPIWCALIPGHLKMPNENAFDWIIANSFDLKNLTKALAILSFVHLRAAPIDGCGQRGPKQQRPRGSQRPFGRCCCFGPRYPAAARKLYWKAAHWLLRLPSYTNENKLFVFAVL